MVRGFYRHVRNPIYAGFVIILTGQALLFGTVGLLEYAAAAWVVGAAAVRCYEAPGLPASSVTTTGPTGAPPGLDTPAASLDPGVRLIIRETHGSHTRDVPPR